MGLGTMVRKLMALGLCLLLGSCSATRPMVVGPSGPWDLSRYVLVIEKTADGQATHAWKPAKDFELTEYRNLASVRADEGRIVRVSLDAAKCEHQYDLCVPECQASTRIHQVDKYIYDYFRLKNAAGIAEMWVRTAIANKQATDWASFRDYLRAASTDDDALENMD